MAVKVPRQDIYSHRDLFAGTALLQFHDLSLVCSIGNVSIFRHEVPVSDNSP